VFSFVDGKLRQVREYFCNILANVVPWPLVEKMGDAGAVR
jgi:hypothetical protein